MNAKDVIRFNMTMGDFLWSNGTADLSDDDLFVRTSPAANHLAWQWGHVIGSERRMLETISPGSAPALPEAFEENHSKATADSADRKGFLTKSEYAALHAKVREASVALLERLPEARLDEPAPESMRQFFPTVGAMMALMGLHQMWHMGQVTSVRRQLNKPDLF